jgi:hypothetical protein
MMARYIAPVLNITGGEAVLATTERYLGNDRNVDLTAKDLEAHPQYRPTGAWTVRGGHRLLTARNDTVVEVWWALARRRLS